MTKTLFHGDNQASSRKDLTLALDTERKSGKEIHFIDGTKISPKDLETSLNSINMFTEEIIVIENLGSRQLSGDKKKAIELIKTYHGSKNIYLWEKKELTKTQVNSFGKEIVAKVSKTPAIIFQFLDALEPGNASYALKLMHDTLNQAEEGFIFVMISRHVADLIIASSGDTNKLIPFKRSRLISQARKFSENQLLSLHARLLEADRALKTGQTKLTYLDHLDLILVELLN